MSVNKVILLGRLGKDPEVKKISENNTVANLSIATSEKFKKADGSYEELTEWHNVVFWNKTAELAERLLTKGTLVYLEGKLFTRKWTDKDGNTRYSTCIKADNFNVVLDGKKKDQSSETNESHQQGPANVETHTEPTIDDDLPF